MTENALANPLQGVVRALNWFIPADMKTNPGLRIRAQCLVGLCLLISLVLIVVGDYPQSLLSSDPRIQIQNFAIMVVLFGPLLLRQTGSLGIFVLFLVLVESMILVVHVLISGGLSSPALYWYPVIPIACLLYLRPYWGGLVLALFLGLVVFLVLTAYPESGYVNAARARSVVLATTIPAVLMFMVVVTYVWMEKRAREERDRSEVKYRQLVESPLQGLMVFRGDTILFVNQACADLFGASSIEGLLSVEVSSLLGDRMLEHVDQGRFTFVTRRFDMTALHIDAMVSELDWQGMPATQVFFRDVTKEQEALQQLELVNADLGDRVAERTRALELKLVQMDMAQRLSKLSYWEWHVDTALLKVSPTLGDVMGIEVPADTIPVDLFVALLHRDDRQRMLDHAEETVLTGASYDTECRFVITDQPVRWFRLRGQAINWTPGTRAEVIVGSIQDVTSQHIEQERNLEEQRRASLGAIAAGLAHDFNNILTPISAYADLIKTNEKSELTQKYAGLIGVSTTRAAGLVQQILAFARQAPGKNEAIDLVAMVEETLTLLSPAFPSSISVQTTLSCDKPFWGDPVRVQSILMNLCVNARDAMSEGGVLSVELKFDSSASGQASAILVVRDSGAGMDEEVQQRMFEPYFSTKTASSGTGLGLAVVDGFVHDLGGDVQVASAPGQGTSVTVTMPFITPPERVPVPDLREQPIAGKLRLLVVDDDASVLEVIRIGLVSVGHEVTAFSSPVEALTFLKQSRAEGRDTPDSLIVDYSMPEMNGDRFVQRAEEIIGKRPVLMISGDLKGYSAADLGVTMIQEKPFTISTLVNRIGELQQSRVK